MTWEIALVAALAGVILVLLGSAAGRMLSTSPSGRPVTEAEPGSPSGTRVSLLLDEVRAKVGELEAKVLSCERNVRSMQDQAADWYEKANRLDKRLYMRERRARQRREDAEEEGEEGDRVEVLADSGTNHRGAAAAPDWFEAELRS